MLITETYFSSETNNRHLGVKNTHKERFISSVVSWILITFWESITVHFNLVIEHFSGTIKGKL